MIGIRNRLGLGITKYKESFDSHLSNSQAGNSIRNAAYSWINDYAEKAININRESMKTSKMDELYAEFSQKKGKQYMDKIRTLLSTFIDTEAGLLVVRKEEADR